MSQQNVRLHTSQQNVQAVRNLMLRVLVEVSVAVESFPPMMGSGGTESASQNRGALGNVGPADEPRTYGGGASGSCLPAGCASSANLAATSRSLTLVC